MGPDALPLQYVSTPLDEYIAEIFYGVSFAAPDDLASLYEATSAFFSAAAPTPAPVPGMTDAPVEPPTPSEAPGTEMTPTPVPVDTTDPPVEPPTPAPVGTTDPPVEPPTPSEAPGTEGSPTQTPETEPPTEEEPGSSASCQKSGIALVALAFASLQFL